MFRRRKLEMRLVQDRRTHEVHVEPRRNYDPEEITKIIHDNVRYVAIACIGIYAAKSMIDTASTIAINNTQPRREED